MLLRIAPWFSGEVVVYESLIPGGTVSFMIDGEGRALNKSRSLRGAWVVPVYSKWWDSPAQGHTGPYITAGTTSTVYRISSRPVQETPLIQPHPPLPRTSTSEHLGGDIQGNTECTIRMVKYLHPKNFYLHFYLCKKFLLQTVSKLCLSISEKI